MIDIPSLAAGVFIGLGLGWYQFHPRKKEKQRGMRVVYDFTPPVVVEPTADEEQWAVYLAAFGLQCSFLKRPTERAVVKARIVDSPTDYRAYAKVLRQNGVWTDRGARYATRWHDRHPRRAIGQLRHAISQGRVRPRWPAPHPPAVYAVFNPHAHAQRKAERAEIADRADAQAAPPQKESP